MKKGKSRKDLAENLLTQKLIPLEDRLFLPVFAAAALIFLGLTIFLQEFPTLDAIHRERIALMTGEHWHLKNGNTPGSIQPISLKSLKDLENLEPYSIVTLKTDLLPEFTARGGENGPLDLIQSEEFYFATFQKTPDEITYFAVPVSAIAYHTGKSIPLPAALMTIAISLGSLILAVRLIFRRYVFSHLDIITKTIFARKVFYATGGIALDSSGREIDGRLHIIHSTWQRVRTIFLTLFNLKESAKPEQDNTATNPHREDEKAQPVTIERIPEAPRIPHENFRNDEIGQIAATLEESYTRHERHQKVLSDLIEAIPCPVLVLEKEGKLFNANSLFLEQQGISREKLVSVSGSETRSLLENHLYFPESLSKRIAHILEQTAPRIIGKEFEFVSPRGSKIQRVSASTISNYGRRLGIIVLEGGNSLSAQQLYEIVSELSSQQLAALERLNACIKKLEKLERETAFKACESLIDSVNALVDLTNMNREGNKKSHLEFNLVSFFRNIPSRLTSTSPVDISLSKELPLFVQGNPMHLRQCIKAIVESYYQLNSQIKVMTPPAELVV
jgi:PAS domain-containing protein